MYFLSSLVVRLEGNEEVYDSGINSLPCHLVLCGVSIEVETKTLVLVSHAA